MTQPDQAGFARALTDRAMPVPDGLVGWNGPQIDRRFGVYRNNVAWGLIEALRSRFPATSAIVGEDFFTAMAGEYIRLEPPRSPLLLAYGDTFARFVEDFAPAVDLAYLADVVRLEAARSHAYHAADHAALDAGSLARIPPERLPILRLQRHPSLSVIRSAYPVVRIWSMNAGERPLGPIEDWRGEDALVVRPEMTVHVHVLPNGGATFVDALASGDPLGVAVQAAMASAADFDLTANLALILQSGAFAEVD